MKIVLWTLFEVTTFGLNVLNIIYLDKEALHTNVFKLLTYLNQKSIMITSSVLDFHCRNYKSLLVELKLYGMNNRLVLF